MAPRFDSPCKHRDSWNSGVSQDRLRFRDPFRRNCPAIPSLVIFTCWRLIALGLPGDAIRNDNKQTHSTASDCRGYSRRKKTAACRSGAHRLERVQIPILYIIIARFSPRPKLSPHHYTQLPQPSATSSAIDHIHFRRRSFRASALLISVNTTTKTLSSSSPFTSVRCSLSPPSRPCWPLSPWPRLPSLPLAPTSSPASLHPSPPSWPPPSFKPRTLSPPRFRRPRTAPPR